MTAISDRLNHSRLLLTVPAALMAMTLGTSVAQARLVNIETGLISSAIEANIRCNAIANQNDGDWKGRWWTTPSQASYCQIEVDDAPVYNAPPAAVIPPPPHGLRTRSIEVGIIWNSDQANQRCSALARTMGGEWNGQWTTSDDGKTSYCQIKGGNPRLANAGDGRPRVRTTIREISAGPIRGDRQAARRCARVAADVNGRWTGDWRPTGSGEAVCSVEVQGRNGPPPRATVEVDTVYVDRTPAGGRRNVREVAAGPIWDQNQASTKCPYIASTQNATWTGKWRKLGPDHQSVCEVRFPG
jgi:hypothetical protein